MPLFFLRRAAAAVLSVLALGAVPFSLSAATPAAAPAPRLPAADGTEAGPAFPHFASAAALRRDCDRRLAQARREERALAGGDPDTWLARYDDLIARVEDATGAISLLENVHPQVAMRDAAQACGLRWQQWQSAFGQNEAVFRQARRAVAVDAIDARLRQDVLDAFEDAGVALPRAGRARLKRLSDEISRLAQDFERDVRDGGTRLAFTEAELAGVPEPVWREAPRDAQGRRLLSLDYPVYGPVLERATDPTTRERMWRAKTDEGGEANLRRLERIATLRHEMARLLGQPDFVDHTLRRRMAGDGATAAAFLQRVREAVEPGERRDLEELRAAKAAHLGRPLQEVTIQRWDRDFYAERLRQARFGVDQEAFRPHFPPQPSLDLMFAIAERLFGVRFEPVAMPLWHPDARAWQVREIADGRPLGLFYADLHPRPGKYNHAAVWSFRNASTRLGRLPQAALVVNVDRHGLTFDELETLLHEFGHALHGLLSATRHVSQGGTNVLRDFVEAPSQMLEDWVYDPQVLALLAARCPACAPVPEALRARAVAARAWGQASLLARQRVYAAYDLALHGARREAPLPLWARLEGETPWGHVPGTRFPAGFSHLVGGYGAGYYGYLWSLVVAVDLRTAFDGRKLDPEVGMRYRRTILARGGEVAPQALVREFLGRETDTRAFDAQLRRP
jgi:thimet oligopeptidase